MGPGDRVGVPAHRQPVRQQPMSALGQHRLRMELHPVQRQRRVPHGHDDPRLRARSPAACSARSRVDGQRVVARVAVNGVGRPSSTPDPSWWTAEVFPWTSSGARPTVAPMTTPERLVPGAHPEHRLGPVRARLDHRHRHPSLLGVPGPGR